MGNNEHRGMANLDPRGMIGRIYVGDFVCVGVLRPSQPNGVMSSVVSLPSHTFTGQA